MRTPHRFDGDPPDAGAGAPDPALSKEIDDAGALLLSEIGSFFFFAMSITLC
jgi:hypothetical protein